MHSTVISRLSLISTFSDKVLLLLGSQETHRASGKLLPRCTFRSHAKRLNFPEACNLKRRFQTSCAQKTSGSCLVSSFYFSLVWGGAWDSHCKQAPAGCRWAGLGLHLSSEVLKNITLLKRNSYTLSESSLERPWVVLKVHTVELNVQFPLFLSVKL